METQHIGKERSRVDGPAKVTGRAKYASEVEAQDLAYGVVVSSAVPRGRIKRIDQAAALAVPGVLSIFTHENARKTARRDKQYKDDDAPPGSPFRPLQGDGVRYSGQPVALVVADSFEAARHAAGLVAIEYETAEHQTSLLAATAFAPKKGRSGWHPPESRGDAARAMKTAEASISTTYATPAEHHNPMEMHASTVEYHADGSLTITDKTQGVQNSQHYVCTAFGLVAEMVRVRAPFIGGAFGSGLRPQYQLYLAVMAALALERSVRVTLTRQQMFSFGHRPMSRQTISLGAKNDGTLVAIRHTALAETSRFETYTENVVDWSGIVYKCADVELKYKVAPLDLYTPIDMRAPGAALGVFALECGMDDLAHRLRMDPLALRLKNYAEKDQSEDRPFSSKELRACYEQGAARFGWAARAHRPRSMRRGRDLVGWGMATGMWEAETVDACAKAVLRPDGRFVIQSAITDIGTGTYTFMAQIAAETLGVPLADVTIELADSGLPGAPLQGGSWTAASVGSAVKAACDGLLERIATAGGGRNGRELACAGSSAPNQKELESYGRYTHSAVFVEVLVDEDLGTITVSRAVAAVAAGRILNPKTARSQVLGGVVWGISMALAEESLLDDGLGRFMNHNLAEYHVPVHADIDAVDVIFVPERDEIVNPLGVKGVGEIGIVGTPAAVSNAIFHATGKRVTSLPITLDKVLAATRKRKETHH